MDRSVKIAISLPRGVLDAVERARLTRGESRSAFFRHAVEALLRQERERAAVERYVQGYREQPETAEEVAVARQSSAAILVQEPWE